MPPTMTMLHRLHVVLVSAADDKLSHPESDVQRTLFRRAGIGGRVLQQALLFQHAWMSAAGQQISPMQAAEQDGVRNN